MKQLEDQLAPAPSTLRHKHTAWWYLALALYSFFLLASTCYIASHRHLWFDEIDTFFIGTLPSLKAIWHTLLLGTDGQPLGFYFPVHLSYLLFGSSELSLRLCAIVPFWLTTLVLYYAVARRTSPLYGFIAALTPAFTVAFQYSFEARPYAMVLLFSACSFLAWQFAKEQRMRALSVPAIGIAIAAAIYVHYNALLIVIPILIGELAYTSQKRKIDFPVLIALCLSGIPLLLSLPHIHAIHAYSKNYWSHIAFSTLFDIYFILATKFVVIAIIAAALFAFWLGVRRSVLRHLKADFGQLPGYEVAAAGGYLLLPVACFILAIYTKALHYRYVIATIIGFSLLVPFLLWMFRSVAAKAAGALCIVLVLNLLYTGLSRMRAPDEESWGTYAEYSDLFSPHTKQIYDSAQPLILGDGPFLVAAKYGSLALRTRAFYPVSDTSQSNNSPAVFRGLSSAVPGPFHLVDFEQFKQSHPTFLMYDPEDWVLNQVLAEGDQVDLIAHLPHAMLYGVTVKARTVKH